MFEKALKTSLYMTIAFYFVSVMMQTEYWCSLAASAEKSCKRWVLSVKKKNFYLNLRSIYKLIFGFIRGGLSQIFYVMVAGRLKVIVKDRSKGRRCKNNNCVFHNVWSFPKIQFRHRMMLSTLWFIVNQLLL